MSQSASSSQTNSLSSNEFGESEPVAADYRNKEILNKIASDLEKAFHCEFDDLSRYFMSMCLNGKDKKRFEERQTAIERIQDKYNSEYTDDDSQQSASDVQDNPTASLDEVNELVVYRDKFLDVIFQRCLRMVLVIANDSVVKNLLGNFSMSRSDPTPEGHKQYAALCNYVLDLMEDLKGLPLRKKAELDLRVSCANPYKHHGEALEFVRTSRHAAVSARSTSMDTSDNASFGEAPDNGFSWSQMLSCDKVISFKPHISAEAVTVLQPGARFGIERKVIMLYDQYGYDASEPLFENPVASSSTHFGTKRAHSGSDDDPPSNKRPRQVSSSTKYMPPMPFVQQAIPTVKDEAPQAHPLDKAEVHSVAYAMEMLSYGVGVSHVINTIVADEYLWIWYHDRQGIIRSNGISIIADFPRFLTLLLFFQRFTSQDWGIVPCLNGESLVRHGLGGKHVPGRTESTHAPFLASKSIKLELEGDHFSHTQREDLERPLQSPITILANKYLSRKPHGIVGAATSVFEADCGGVKLACKIYSPEAERRHEGLTSRLVRAIATSKNPGMLDHLPELYFAGDFRRCSTMRVRSMVKIGVRYYRALRIIVLPKLDAVTSLDGKSFVDAWLDAVTCHAFLWKHGVEHGDPSLSNVMYHPIRQCGVLMDFDLAAIQWLPLVPGTDKTGTIPYMALNLLCQEYWNGGVMRYYHHELEAFIWILIFVFFCFKDHKLDTDNTFNRQFNTSDFNACKRYKKTFLTTSIPTADTWVQDNFTDYKGLLKELCLVIQSSTRFRTVWGPGPIILNNGRPATLTLRPLHHDKVSTDIWDAFISVLDEARLNSARIKFNKPDFGHKDDKTLFDEMKTLYYDLLKRTG